VNLFTENANIVKVNGAIEFELIYRVMGQFLGKGGCLNRL
jgi:hypothetical protein